MAAELTVWSRFFVGIEVAFVAACGGTARPSAPEPGGSPVGPGETSVKTSEAAPASTAAGAAPLDPGSGGGGRRLPYCTPDKWPSRSLPPLLSAGKKPNPKYADRFGNAFTHYDQTCTDHPDAAPVGRPFDATIEGVKVVTSVTPAGKTGRGWPGNQCTFDLAQTTEDFNMSVRLGPEVVPPFNALTALVRSGSRVWVELSYNGYTKDFPRGGNRVVAIDVCDGRVVWKSNDGVSNGGLLLVGDYLITAFGFTSELRYVHVFDAYSGKLVQKLPVLENICPSKAWAPKWDGGRCDAPGQLVGAASNLRIEGGLFLVDTNTGSAAFELE